MLFLLAACSKQDIDACIQERIDSFGTEMCPTDASVKRYQFQGNAVYVINAGPCINDGTEEVLDANCTLLGYLGGLAGFTDINGEHFYNNATYESTVWTN